MILTACIKLFVAIFIIFWSSIFFYLSFQSFYVPKNVLLREPLYFDYSLEKPIAKIKLLAEEKQWEYTNQKRNLNVERYKSGERFLKHGISYVISMEISLSKSSRNKELAKFMLHTRAVDAKGSNVASSSRPIIIPYQSRITRLLEGIVFWPLREIGLVQSSETIQVREELMNNYLENVEPTDKLEFSLSTNAADIEGAYLSIFPRFNMVSSFIFYHPRISSIVGVCIIAFLEAVACSVIFSVYYMLKYLTNPEGVRRRAWTDDGTEFGSDEDEYDFVSQDSDELYFDSDEDKESEEEEADGGEDENVEGNDKGSDQPEDHNSAEIVDEGDKTKGLPDGLRKRK